MPDRVNMQYKKLICLMLILANLFMIIPVLPSAAAEEEIYNYQQAIDKMIEKGVLSPAEGGELVPDEAMSRGEFAVMAAKLFRQEGEAVDVLNKLGFIPAEMLSGGDFNPDTAILREEAAVILHRAFLYAYEHDGEGGVNIKDILAAAPYAQNSIVRMCAMGFMSIEKGNFNPKAALTNKEAARTAYELFYTDETYTVKYAPGTYKNGELAQDTVDAYYRGARKVTVQPGTYHLYNKAEAVGTGYRAGYYGFNGLKDFTVDGTGVTFIGHEPELNKDGASDGISIISFYECDYLTLRGFTCDYAELLFTQGEIVEIIEGKSTTDIIIDIDEGYSQDFGNRAYFPATPVGTLVDPKTMGYKAGAPNLNIKPIEKVEGYDRRWVFRNSSVTGDKYAQVGDLISFRMNQVGPFCVTGRQCNNLLVEDITVYSGHYGIVMGQSIIRDSAECDETTILRNCKVTYGPKPEGATRERLTSSYADAINVGHRSGKTILENCFVQGNTDDSYSMGSRTYIVMDWGEEPNSFYAGTPGYPQIIAPGDTLAIYDENSNYIGTTKVTKIEDPGDYKPAADVATVAGFDMSGRMRLFTVDDVSLIERGLYFYDTDGTTKGVELRNCTAINNNGRGALTQTWNVLVDGCTFISTAKAGYFPVAEKHCVQGPAMNNIVVRNSKFIQCNRKAENTPSGLYKPGGAFSNVLNETGRANANIIIEDCYFEDNYGSDILLGNTRGATIRNCTFGKRNSYASNKNYCNDASVRITNSEDVIFEGNTSLTDRPMMSWQDVDNLQSDYEGAYSSEFTLSAVNDGTKEWSFEYAPVGKDEYHYYDYQYWTSGSWVRVVPLWSKDKQKNTDYGYIESLYEVSPGLLNDFVATFKAPFSGKVKIMFNEGLPIKETGYNSDGIRIKILKNEKEQVWPQSGWKVMEFERNQSYIEDTYVDVEKGDLLRFRVNCNNTQTHDTLLFSPEIRYIEVDETDKEGMITEVPEKAELTFKDIDAFNWSHHMIAELMDKGIVTGENESVFNPQKEIDRSEFVTMLYRMAGKPSVNASVVFGDVSENAWYHDAVAWAVENGIVNGVSETSFAPSATITKEQLTAMLYRYAQLEKYDVSETMSLESYTDAWKISPYALDAVTWGLATGIIKGSSPELLVPYTNPTRVETAHILYKFLHTK